MGDAARVAVGWIQLAIGAFALMAPVHSAVRDVAHAGFLTLLVSAMLLGCGQPAQQPTPPSGSPPPGCTADLAVAKAQALFDAFNRSDADALVVMFPAPGSTAFVIQPELEFADAPPFPPGTVHAARNPDELRALVAATAGYRLQFSRAPAGQVNRIDYVTGGKSVWVWTASVSGVHWSAVGPRGTFGGGSKLAFNCESGRFLRVLL